MPVSLCQVSNGNTFSLHVRDSPGHVAGAGYNEIERGGEVSCESAAPSALATLSAMMPGSMPAESEAFSSSASLRTIRDFALQQSWGAVTGHL